jgi:hypothetical protein
MSAPICHYRYLIAYIALVTTALLVLKVVELWR